MYDEFYKLSGKPFQLAPDPSFYFKSKGHQRAMAYMQYGLEQGQGFIVITGDIGTGKSTLVSNLFKELDRKDLVAAKIVSSNVGDHDLLRLVAAGFGLSFERQSKATLLQKLEQLFLSIREEGKRALLVVDECQNLPNKALEELRMLSNFELDSEPLLQTFLLGQREFRRTMRSQGFVQLRQRVTAAYHLKPLSERETKRYILHRLSRVDWQDDPEFDDDVFHGIYLFTDGVPRRINTLCDRLLLNCCLDEKHRISMEELRIVTDEIEIEHGELDPEEDYHPGQMDKAEASEEHSGANANVNADIARLEKQLAAMQSAVESVSRNVQTVATQQSMHAQRPVDEHERPYGLQPTEKPYWGLALRIFVSLIIVGAFSAYYLYKN